MSPPERESRPGNTEADPVAVNDTVYSTSHGRQAANDTLAAIRRRPYKPSSGLRASGYREGYAACLRWVQREFDEHLDEIGRARLATILARSEAA